MPRDIHTPLIPPAHSASSMRKELSPLHYPCYPVIYKKNIFSWTVLVEQGVRPEKNQAANIQADMTNWGHNWTNHTRKASPEKDEL